MFVVGSVEVCTYDQQVWFPTAVIGEFVDSNGYWYSVVHAGQNGLCGGLTSEQEKYGILRALQAR